MAHDRVGRKRFTSEKSERFSESVIREMTRQAMLYDAINLAQGFPDFAAPQELKHAAQQAIAADLNQYAITWGAKNLRDAIAHRMSVAQGLQVDPETEITVCCGSTEAMIASLMAVTNARDEIVIFEPFYENYGPDAILSGARPRFVKLNHPRTRTASGPSTSRSCARRSADAPRRSSSTRQTTPRARFSAGPNWN